MLGTFANDPSGRAAGSRRSRTGERFWSVLSPWGCPNVGASGPISHWTISQQSSVRSVGPSERPHDHRGHELIDLDGKVAVVTGAASGIGRAITRGFVAAGAKVLAADIDEAGVWRTAELCDDPTAVEPVRADVSDP